MSKGLKQMVEEALPSEAEPASKVPKVTVSDEALRAYAFKMREWSGWPNARLEWGNPIKFGSPFAACNHNTRTFTANPETLVLNPNRVLLTVTPFRMRQEAVLTGALLHEAGHARHSHWRPRTDEQAAAFRHSDGTEVTPQALALAVLAEEPRVEGLMARDSISVGAAGLDWTMRASAARLVPTTNLSVTPGQRVMDVLTSWVLRAGRQVALASHTNHRIQTWASDFTNLLHGVIHAHLTVMQEDGGAINNPDADTKRILELLVEMIQCTDDDGPTMVDKARDVLVLLFPETDDEDGAESPMPGAGCMVGEMGEEGEADEGEDGTGNSDPEDEGEGDEPGAGDAGPDEEAEQSEAEDGASPSTEAEADDTEAEAEAGDDEAEAEAGDDEAEAETAETAEDDSADQTDTDSELAQQLREMEEKAKRETEEESNTEAAKAPSGGTTGSDTGGSSGGRGYREPTKDEREIQHGAERFLRTLIEPSEKGKVVITDQPSSTVDGAALAAWKAGGQVREPTFFRRTKREIEPSPPVKIAILVDVSGSMDELQGPSALLSWALSAAAMDLRNFAGRGQQIESCLIHWGSEARVIQHNNEPVPGIKEFGCYEGTYVMAEALELVEQEMPGFFDLTDKPVNRLLVQFTDWQLAYSVRKATVAAVGRALSAGVNMISVVPGDYSVRNSCLPDILSSVPVQRGKNMLMKYNTLYPERVWDNAAEMLNGAIPAPFAGF